MKIKRRLEKAGMTLIWAAVSLISPSYVSAHIFDERPGLGTRMTIMLSIIWIAVVIGIVLLVRRLLRPQHGVTGNRDREDNNKIKKER